MAGSVGSGCNDTVSKSIAIHLRGKKLEIKAKVYDFFLESYFGTFATFFKKKEHRKLQKKMNDRKFQELDGIRDKSKTGQNGKERKLW